MLDNIDFVLLSLAALLAGFVDAVAGGGVGDAERAVFDRDFCPVLGDFDELIGCHCFLFP